MASTTDPCYFTHFDLVTPDGHLKKLHRVGPRLAEGVVYIEHISPKFVGFDIDKERVHFNFKSTLAQLGLDARLLDLSIDKKFCCAEVRLEIRAIGAVAEKMLDYLQIGANVGKLFAADERRRVRDPHYLGRMFGRSDRKGRPLLSLGGLQGSGDLILEKIEDRTVAYLTLQHGKVTYDKSIEGFLPTIGQALCTDLPLRKFLRLHQKWNANQPRTTTEDEILLVRTLPLHIRTVFARVCDELLSEGYTHTAANVLQPDTTASGDIYELFGSSEKEVSDVPLEFYTLEPYREHVFFADRDQLQACLEGGTALFNAFKTAPQPSELKASVFVAKGEQLLNLSEDDWITREPVFHEFPGPAHGSRQAAMVERYIQQQPAYPFLHNIDMDVITSQGILLSRYFPTPLMKRMLLGDSVQRCVKGIYFQYPSLSENEYFSSEDRALLHDLYKFAVPVFWVDARTNRILQYVEREEKDSGMFVPLDRVEMFLESTVFGIYGSNLLKGDFEHELRAMLEGVLEMRGQVNHPELQAKTPLALVTGGGPGAMEVGNQVAMDLGILSCANIVNFGDGETVNEQQQNPYVEAKMTYRLDKLVERQAEFHLDFPIFLTGGIGTDFEMSLEEVRRKTGSCPATPILLMGEVDYWIDKITTRFRRNVESGTIKGSEWLSNCYFCIQTAEQGLKVYRDYFSGELAIGPNGPIYDRGFVTVEV